jgi:SNF2 family DNA or RNA helicase
LIRRRFKDLSIPRHRGLEATGDATNEPVITHADLLDVVFTNPNNNFENKCLDLAFPRLGVQWLEPRKGDIVPVVKGILGIPNGQFLPHQVWGVWFLVASVISNTAPVALLADDMGLGKTYTLLGALLHLKWVLSEACMRRELACFDGRSVEDLDNVHPFFGSQMEIYMRPSILMVPANLMGTWTNGIERLLP